MFKSELNSISEAYLTICESSSKKSRKTVLPNDLTMVRRTPKTLREDERGTILAMLVELDRLHDEWHEKHGLDIVHMKKKDFDERQNQRIDSAEHIFLALDSDGKVCGVCMYQSGRFEECQMCTALFVSPSHRGSGVGKALLTKSMSELKSRGITNIEIQVSEYNKAGKALYDDVGFKNITYGMIRKL